MATISLNVVDKLHARLLQHIADAWDLRQTIQAHCTVSPANIVRAGQEAIDKSEMTAQRALDETLRDWLVLWRNITWWQSPGGHANKGEIGKVDQSQMHALDRTNLHHQAEQILAADPSTATQFVVRAEALVLPPFENGW